MIKKLIILPIVLFANPMLMHMLNVNCLHVSRVMRKPTFCICENKDADQLRFRYIDSPIPLLSKSEISGFLPSSVAVQPGLCRTRSETRMLVFSWHGSCTCKLSYFLYLGLEGRILALTVSVLGHFSCF